MMIGLKIKRKEREVRVTDVFKYRGRWCVVIQQNFHATSSIGKFHNGYVSTRPSNSEREYDKFARRIETDELTFSGKLAYMNDKFEITLGLQIPDVWFLGFDSGHHWNEMNPESKTRRSVKERVIQLADEMIKKGI